MISMKDELTDGSAKAPKKKRQWKWFSIAILIIAVLLGMIAGVFLRNRFLAQKPPAASSTAPTASYHIEYAAPSKIPYNYEGIILICGSFTNEHEIWLDDIKLSVSEVEYKEEVGLDVVSAYFEAQDFGIGNHSLILKNKKGKKISKLEDAIEILKKERRKERISKANLVFIILAPLSIVSLVLWIISRLFAKKKEQAKQRQPCFKCAIKAVIWLPKRIGKAWRNWRNK